MKRVLLVIDLQNDFLPGGTLAVREGDTIIEPIKALINSGNYDLTIASQDWHPAAHTSFLSTGNPEALWPDHCIQETHGAQFAPGIDPTAFDTIIQKGTHPEIDSYSAFFDNQRKQKTNLEAYLKETDVAHVTIAGLATDYCVKFTALHALELGYDVAVVTDACCGLEAAQEALQEMERAGAELISSETALTTSVLYRPTGRHEWAEIEATGHTRWPKRLPDQPIFYPVTNARYAREIAQRWNATPGKHGYVTRFRVLKTVLDRYKPECVGARYHTEYWIPAEELPAFNQAIQGKIEAIEHYEGS